jgi:LuxR family maltose regulon positive regulatory protein
LGNSSNRKSSIENGQSLSSRETEVLQLIAQGLTNKEIAKKLVIAPSTAKRHTVNIYNKLGISNRAEATTKAYELGIVDLA